MDFNTWDVVLFILCLWASFKMISWSNRKEVELELKERPAVHTDPKYIWIVIERNEDGLFAYNAKKGNYLAHGKTLEDMCNMFRERFPENTGLLVTPISKDDNNISIKEFTL